MSLQPSRSSTSISSTCSWWRISRIDSYLRSNEIALEEDVVKACEDFDEERLEVLKNHNQLNFVQQQVNRIGKNLQISAPVDWYCEEDDALLKQAEGDESGPM